MSYCLTDAGEQDMRKELAVLENLNDEIDQLAATARDCMTVAPNVAAALDLAWFYAEEAGREAGHSSCGHIAVQVKPFCQCCHSYAERKSKAAQIRRLL